MCKLKSALILKDRVFIPDYDSHSDMLDELKIEDTRANAERLFVRAELYPKDNDVFSPVDTWEFNVDQDIVPEWFVKEVDKERMITAVKEWAKARIFVGVNNLKIESGKGYYLKDCKDVEVCGNGTVNEVFGNGTVNKVYGNGTVNEVFGNGTVNKVYGNGTVNKVYGNGTVNKVYGNGTVNEVCGNGTVNEVCGNGTVNEVCGNGTVNEVCQNGTVKWVCGNGTVNEVCQNGTVNEVCENGTVNKVYENGTVNKVYENGTVKWVFGNGTVNEVCENGTVNEGKGFSTIIGSPYGWKNKEQLILSENATFKDCQAKIIYQSGDWELRKV